MQALLNPDFYPGHPSNIELVQNLTSYVFLTGEYAYKIKKPIVSGFLDYTTLEKRRYYCEREIVLNKRLCPDLYLDTVSVTEGNAGLSVEGEGKAIEYAVKMKQMPRHGMLDVLLGNNTLPENAMDKIARKLSDFHEKAATNDVITYYGDLEFLLTSTEYNFMNSIRYLSKTISRKSYQSIKYYVNKFIENNPALFFTRIYDGKIRDCHGDIRVKHVCVNNDVYIFDCIEFNDSLRYCDVASDLATLAVDLDRHGCSDLSAKLVESYVSITGDENLLKLLNFYKCCRAYEIGRRSSIKLENAENSREKADEITAAATRYFELAESYI